MEELEEMERLIPILLSLAIGAALFDAIIEENPEILNTSRECKDFCYPKKYYYKDGNIFKQSVCECREEEE